MRSKHTDPQQISLFASAHSKMPRRSSLCEIVAVAEDGMREENGGDGTALSGH